jgi:hypothetical protein
MNRISSSRHDNNSDDKNDNISKFSLKRTIKKTSKMNQNHQFSYEFDNFSKSRGKLIKPLSYSKSEDVCTFKDKKFDFSWGKHRAIELTDKKHNIVYTRTNQYSLAGVSNCRLFGCGDASSFENYYASQPERGRICIQKTPTDLLRKRSKSRQKISRQPVIAQKSQIAQHVIKSKRSTKLFCLSCTIDAKSKIHQNRFITAQKPESNDKSDAKNQTPAISQPIKSGILEFDFDGDISML